MKRRREEDAEVTTASATVLEAQQKKRQRSEVEETHRPTADATAKLAMHSKVPLGMSADAVSSGGTLATWRLAESRHKGRYSVLVFYPLDFTFVCPTELIGFSDRLDDFDAIKCDVAGVSVDSKYTHLAWLRTPRNAGGLAPVGDHQKPFVLPLVSDLTHALSKSFGVFDEECGHSKRAVVIVSDAGVVREVLVNDDAVGRSVDEVLRLVQALQYADAHDGEACPVNWTPGNATIKADPVGSKEYFNTDMDQ